MTVNIVLEILYVSKKVRPVVLQIKYDLAENTGCCMHHVKAVGCSVGQIWLNLPQHIHAHTHTGMLPHPSPQTFLQNIDIIDH